MNIKDELLESFGKELSERTYDISIDRIKNIFNGNVNAKKLIAYNQSIMHEDDECKEKIKVLCYECIRNTLHNFLWMIEQSDDFDLVAKTDEGLVSLKEISDGLCGELYTEDGWISKYSAYPNLID